MISTVRVKDSRRSSITYVQNDPIKQTTQDDQDNQDTQDDYWVVPIPKFKSNRKPPLNFSRDVAAMLGRMCSNAYACVRGANVRGANARGASVHVASSSDASAARRTLRTSFVVDH